MAKGGSGDEKRVEAAMPKDAPPNGDALTGDDPAGRIGWTAAAGIGDAGHPSPRCEPTPRQTPWRARCGESRTPGSASGLGKRTSSNAGTAPQADSTVAGMWSSDRVAATRGPGPLHHGRDSATSSTTSTTVKRCSGGSGFPRDSSALLSLETADDGPGVMGGRIVTSAVQSRRRRGCRSMMEEEPRAVI
jgi:hypothetical protein